MSKKTLTTTVYDGLVNILTGQGMFGKDKAMSSIWDDTTIDWLEMENAYSSDWLTGKVCRITPFDMTREWRTFDGSIDDKKIEEFEDVEKDLGLRDKVKDAMTWANVYGGCGLVINVDDGQDPWEPLDFSKIKKDGLRFIHDVDAQFLRPRTINHDPSTENYGYPDTYSVATSALHIHHTRVIRFDGVPLPLQGRRRNGYWGKSLPEHIATALKNASSIQQSVGSLIYEASTDVMKISNLMDLVASPEGTQALENRLGIMKIQKSINKMAVIDMEEEMVNHQQQFTNLDKITNQYLAIVAAAADVPITRLLGESSQGLGDSGEGDLHNYYDAIRSKQEVGLRRKLEYIDKIIFCSVFGREPEKGELTFKFNSLYQLNDKEVSEKQEKDSKRDKAYIEVGAIDKVVVAKQLQTDGVYDYIDEEYIKNLEKELKEEKEHEQELKEKLLNGESDEEIDQDDPNIDNKMVDEDERPDNN